MFSIPSAPPAGLCEVLSRVEASLWLVTEAQRCPLVRAAYLGVADSLRRFCCETYLTKLSDILVRDLQTPQRELQVRDTHADTPVYKRWTLCFFSLLLIV